MARAYSNDLRERVVAAVELDGMSCREAAAQFSVGVSTAIRWLARYRGSGSVAPAQIGGYRPKSIAGAHRDWLIERCRGSTFTLRGLVAELAERGLKVDYRTMWSFVHAERMELQKKPCWLPNRIAPTSRAVGRSGERISRGLTPTAWSLSTRPGPRPTWRRCAAGGHAGHGCAARFHTDTGTP